MFSRYGKEKIYMPPQKIAWGITINEGGWNIRNIKWQEHPQGEKGKGKRLIYHRVTTGSQDALFDPLDD